MMSQVAIYHSSIEMKAFPRFGILMSGASELQIGAPQPLQKMSVDLNQGEADVASVSP
jgi:hypothetical protein